MERQWELLIAVGVTAAADAGVSGSADENSVRRSEMVNVGCVKSLHVDCGEVLFLLWQLLWQLLVPLTCHRLGRGIES